MEIRHELGKLARFMQPDLLLEKIKLPSSLLLEAVTHIIPSIELSTDGLTLARLFLVTENFLCDIRIATHESQLWFDVVDKFSIMTYQVNLWTQDITERNTLKARYEIAQLLLFHSPNLATRISYAGEDRALWLAQVAEAIPLKVVLGGRGSH
jgi:hypothetical protein